MIRTTHAAAVALALVVMPAISQQPPEAAAEVAQEMHPSDERPVFNEQKHTARGLIVVADDTAIPGDIAISDGLVVEEGARLRLGPGRVTLAGDLKIRGTLEITDAELNIPTEFTHQWRWHLAGGRFEARDVKVDLPYHVEIEVVGSTARFELDRVTLGGGGLLTVTGREGGAISLEQTLGIGEFIVPPDSPFRADRASYFLLWLVLAEGFPKGGTLAFPAGASVQAFSPRGFDVSVTDGVGVMWGIITAPGVEATIKGAKLRAVASVFGGPGTTTIRDMHTNALPPDDRFAPGDRVIDFEDCEVEAWNFYTVLGHNLVIEDSTIGEAWGFDGTGSITVRRSTLDGSGGTVRAKGQTTLVFEDSRLVPQVIAQGDARIRLLRSRIENDVNATDNALVTLEASEVSGELKASGKARIETTPATAPL
ncbi:MAG: hypothetical protein OXP36_02315 [Gammaproteobacteria bacterium]|nr:hypothetical protein [Gammaproteobacteria bacterium]